MGPVRIGTSGWIYSEWKDGFYAGVPRKRWLAHYASRFDTVEANGTFYGTMKAGTAERWVEETPENFRFSAKGSRWATHMHRLNEAAVESVERQRDSLAALAPKLLAVVWQLPARLGPDPQRLGWFLKALEAWQGPRHAIEFRHRGWFTDETAKALADAGVAVAQSDAPTFPLWDRVTTDLVYVRLHGHTRLYRSRYAGRSLEAWAERIGRWRGEDRTVLVYFDNTDSGHAPGDAVRLREIAG